MMHEVVVGEPRLYSAADATELSVAVDLAGRQFVLSYKTAAAPLNLSGEPFLAASLIPAMKMGVPLRLNGPVSPRLLAALRNIQIVLKSFFPELRKIEIEAEPASIASVRPGRGVACFFSGGMDSFYTFLKHRDEIDALILVQGFDVRTVDQDVWDRISPPIRAAARELGKPLVEVSTNVQPFTDPFLHWNYTCGSAMASIALLLAPLFAKVFIGASSTYTHLFPFGSHPLLDPLWSTEALEIVHDGCEATRVDKAALISTNETALRYLRVCYQNRNEQREVYNCGRCEKCIRTKINLHLVGALDRCATLDHTLDLEAIARLPIHPAEARPLVEDNLEAAERLGADPALIRALRQALDRPEPEIKQAPEAAPVDRAIRRLIQENSALRSTIQAIQESSSWRVTGPLRALGDAARGLSSWINK
jgi:hypothetical protein